MKSAIWFAWRISTFLTPFTRSSDCFTIGGHSTQSAFFTSRTTVLSAAWAGQDIRTAMTAAVAVGWSLRMEVSLVHRNRTAIRGKPTAIKTRTSAVHRPILAKRLEEGLAQ